MVLLIGPSANVSGRLGYQHSCISKGKIVRSHHSPILPLRTSPCHFLHWTSVLDSEWEVSIHFVLFFSGELPGLPLVLSTNTYVGRVMMVAWICPGDLKEFKPLSLKTNCFLCTHIVLATHWIIIVCQIRLKHV